jgi:iron complex outermembrane receptor protein
VQRIPADRRLRAGRRPRRKRPGRHRRHRAQGGGKVAGRARRHHGVRHQGNTVGPDRAAFGYRQADARPQLHTAVRSPKPVADHPWRGAEHRPAKCWRFSRRHLPFGKGGVDTELNDLERVEVIKGPQSALYGRNTFAGAINYVTKRPTDELSGRGEITIGDHGLFKAQASLSGPISETLRFRVGGFYREFNGWYRSAIDGGRVDFEKSYGGIATLEWQPTDALTVTLRGSYIENDDGQPASNVIRTNAAPGRVNNALPTTIRNLLYIGEVPSIPRDGVTVNTQPVAGLPGGSYGDRLEATRLSAKIEYDFGNAVFTSITSYDKRNAEYTYDGDNTLCNFTGCVGFPFGPPIPSGTSGFALSSNDGFLRDISQELRFSSSGNETIDWLVGAFYYDNVTDGVDRGLTAIPASGPTAYSAFKPELFFPAPAADDQKLLDIRLRHLEGDRAVLGDRRAAL